MSAGNEDGTQYLQKGWFSAPTQVVLLCFLKEYAYCFGMHVHLMLTTILYILPLSIPQLYSVISDRVVSFTTPFMVCKPCRRLQGMDELC